MHGRDGHAKGRCRFAWDKLAITQLVPPTFCVFCWHSHPKGCDPTGLRDAVCNALNRDGPKDWAMCMAETAMPRGDADSHVPIGATHLLCFLLADIQWAPITFDAPFRH